MAWFGKAVSKMVDITWTPGQGEFLTLKESKFPNAHVRSYLLEVKDFIPEKYHNRVFLCGGFGACFAGVTKDFGDIDIFCDSKQTFDELLAILKRDSENEQTAAVIDRPEYGRLWKFKRGGQKFDLVEVTPMSGDLAGYTWEGRLVAILCTFDMSWSMAGVSLGEKTEVWMHPKALDKEVRICGNNIKHPDATQERIRKYADRIDGTSMTHVTTAIAAVSKIHDVIPTSKTTTPWNS